MNPILILLVGTGVLWWLIKSKETQTPVTTPAVEPVASVTHPWINSPKKAEFLAYVKTVHPTTEAIPLSVMQKLWAEWGNKK